MAASLTRLPRRSKRLWPSPSHNRKPAQLKPRRILPGFGLSLGFTVFYLCLLVLDPAVYGIFQAATLGHARFWEIISDPRTVAAFKLSFGASALAALLNAFFGLLVAWTLVRYPFPGRRIIDGLVDLPFALPTAVAGICLSAVYAENGWIGPLLSRRMGIRCGLYAARHFSGARLHRPAVCCPHCPAVLQDLETDVEEAAASLGATRGQIFLRVILPTLLPAVLTGFTLAFARALGEYGSVLFISNGLPGQQEIVPMLIMNKLDQLTPQGNAEAAAIAVVMLLASFLLLLLINLGQWWGRKRLGMI